MYHTRLIADYFLFAAKNNAYCIDFLSYQIFDDIAELVLLLFNSYDTQIDILKQALNTTNYEPLLAVSFIRHF